MANKKKSVSAKTLNRAITFTLELYPEWEQISTVLNYIETHFGYAWIQHDKDVYEEGDNKGELKKPHIHAVIKCRARRMLSSVKNEFAIQGVPTNLINTCDKRAMLRYLTHIDYPEKAQYERNLIHTNMQDEIDLAYTDDITSDKAFYLICEWINADGGVVSQYQLNKYAYENNLLGGLRKFGSQINNVRIEHNRQYDIEREIDNKADMKAVKIARSTDVKAKQMFQALEEFGVIKTQLPDENGVMRDVTIALRKPENEPENESQTHQEAIWEGLPRKE